MNRFELFTMIFYALDAEWDKNNDEELGEYLSGANPFIFEDLRSAVPEVYDCFCSIIGTDVKISESYDKAWIYIKTLRNKAVEEAFSKVKKNDWDDAVVEYLSSDHKGSKSIPL